MAYDKLSVINDCLIATGNEPVDVDDGSPGWTVGSSAYDRCLQLILYSRNWTFQTAIVNLARVGDSTYPGYSDVFAKPGNCLFIENVWRSDFAGLVPQVSVFSIDGTGAQPPDLDYDVIGDQIHTVAPEGVTAKIVVTPPEDVPNAWPDGFVEGLRRSIESIIYQGLNEDLEAALKMGQIASLKVEEAAARNQDECPRKVAFRSKMLERRRTRYLGAWW